MNMDRVEQRRKYLNTFKLAAYFAFILPARETMSSESSGIYIKCHYLEYSQGSQRLLAKSGSSIRWKKIRMGKFCQWNMFFFRNLCTKAKTKGIKFGWSTSNLKDPTFKSIIFLHLQLVKSSFKQMEIIIYQQGRSGGWFSTGSILVKLAPWPSWGFSV